MVDAIVWFRRDLRLTDNAALYHALKNNSSVLPIFIFDKNILDALENKQDARVEFIHTALQKMQGQLASFGSTLKVYYGKPEELWPKILQEFKPKAVYTNHDYEPYALQRDTAVGELLAKHSVELHTFKDQCIFEKSEVVKDDGKPYTVFTPYSRKWKQKLNSFYLKSYPTEKYFSSFCKLAPFEIPTLKQMGFSPSGIEIPSAEVEHEIIKKYHEQRDIPSIKGTSRLSVHLRFGTVSIRKLAEIGLKTNEKWLNELIWRDFYMMILWHFPHAVTGAFKPQYNAIEWRNNEQEFKAWCEGKTGYPIVDAGMRELNATGFMHNRVRMITASFLVKHLLVDWRWGEAYFAAKLLDFELSSNNGGWQWAASSGCDAAPYFRVFNPELQTKKFDPDLKYIKKWVPEFQELTYTKPIVEHKYARERVLETYKKALG